jgi:predicted RNase H-like HicB family nuclease
LARFWQGITVEGTKRDESDPKKDGTEADMNGYRFSVYAIRDGEGWAAHCPEFPGCRARGATYEDALANIRDVIRIFVEDGFGDDESPPQPEEMCFTALDLTL